MVQFSTAVDPSNEDPNKALAGQVFALAYTSGGRIACR
jgi:hypothetical protein